MVYKWVVAMDNVGAAEMDGVVVVVWDVYLELKLVGEMVDPLAYSRVD